MKISTCFILKLNGAHSIKSITKLNVSTLTIGKTIEENQTFSITAARLFVQIGKQEHSFPSTMRAALIWQVVNTVMGGKNKSIIQCFTEHCHAKRSLFHPLLKVQP
jgi:hypothetical protein